MRQRAYGIDPVVCINSKISGGESREDGMRYKYLVLWVLEHDVDMLNLLFFHVRKSNYIPRWFALVLNREDSSGSK